jgi:hypothetical protein
MSDYRYFNDLIVEHLVHHTGAYIKKPIKPVARFLADSVEQKEDVIAFTNVSTMPGIDFYSQKKLSPFYYLFNPRFPDTNWQRPIQESKYFVSLHKISSLKFRRLWIISSDWGRTGKLDENSQSVKDRLDQYLKLEFIKEFDGLLISRYVKD